MPYEVFLRLFDRHALGEVARLVHVAPLPGGDVVGEELQWNDEKQRHRVRK
ncbi:MAG: hypothetical protein HYY11_05315 [Candidatus Methylomirabilis oxyfera]|nr:hypothetical protein [Candidatus Methylomirabilis oxyfera]